MAATKAQRGARCGNPKSRMAKATEVSNTSKVIKKKMKKSNSAIIAKESIVIKKKKKNRMKLKVGNRGVCYLSHIPHGFYEPQMKEYFSQFGTVKRVVLRRSNKTGRSRGYAFIEFYNTDVAKIAAETMNNYLMFERVLKCKFIPPEEIPDNRKDLFYNVNIEGIKKRELEKKRVFNAPKSTQKAAKLVNRKNSKAKKLSQILAERGIDFSFEVPKTTSDSNQQPSDLQQSSPKVSGKKKAKVPKTTSSSDKQPTELQQSSPKSSGKKKAKVPKKRASSEHQTTDLQQSSVKASGKKKAKVHNPSSPSHTVPSLLKTPPLQGSKGSKKRRRKKKVA